MTDENYLTTAEEMAVCQKKKKFMAYVFGTLSFQRLLQRCSADRSLLFNDSIDVRQCLAQPAIFIYQLKMQQLSLLWIRITEQQWNTCLCHKVDEQALRVMLENMSFFSISWSNDCHCQLYKSLGAFSWCICKERRKGIFFSVDLRVTTKHPSTVHWANQKVPRLSMPDKGRSETVHNPSPLLLLLCPLMKRKWRIRLRAKKIIWSPRLRGTFCDFETMVLEADLNIPNWMYSDADITENNLCCYQIVISELGNLGINTA